MLNNNIVQYDPVTGEIIRTFNSETHYIRSYASDSFYKSKFHDQDNRHFSFADMEEIKEVISNVSRVHCGYLLILQCYMEFGTGMINISRKDMPKVIGTSERTFIRFMNDMIGQGIVNKVIGDFYINQRYHFRTQTKNKRVVKLFTTTLKQLKDILNPSELGFLYKLLPHVHYNTNMICTDPFTLENIRFLNKKQISILVEMDEKKTSKLLEKLRKIGVIAETIRQDDKRDRIFTLNPYIFYRKNGKPDDTLRGLFASTPYYK